MPKRHRPKDRDGSSAIFSSQHLPWLWEKPTVNILRPILSQQRPQSSSYEGLHFACLLHRSRRSRGLCGGAIRSCHARACGGCVRLHAPPAMVPVLGAWSSPLAMAGAFKIVPPRPGTITRRLQVFPRSGDAFRYSAIESGLRSSLPSI